MQLLFVGKIHEKGEKQNNSEFLQNKATKEHSKLQFVAYLVLISQMSADLIVNTQTFSLSNNVIIRHSQRRNFPSIRVSDIAFKGRNLIEVFLSYFLFAQDPHPMMKTSVSG